MSERTRPDAHRAAGPELLAPAGGPAALRAAIANGADAVYLGVERLNARRGAENFALGELGDATRFAHLRGVRVYLTANVVVRPDEMREALVLVDEAWAAGVDAVIVQDLGLAAVVRRLLPDVRLHASTQLDAADSETVRALADLGAARVTLARETSIERISAISRGVEAELEAFVHGSLCFSHSGRCLMSSAIGGRSANRGLCAQPCRLRYALVGDDGREAATPGAYLLSPRDLAGVTVLPELVASGVAALKIEGRMKSPEYVALVTGVYRRALDRAVADPGGYQVSDAEWNTLAEAFSRGFSEAYLAGVTDDRMMSYTRPNNRGVRVGRVAAVDGARASIELERALESEDTIEVWTARGRFSQRVGDMAVSGRRAVASPAGVAVEIRLEGRAAVGDRVFRVANAALLAAARRTFARGSDEGSVAVGASVVVREGRPLSVELRSRERVGRSEGSTVEPARTKAVTAAEVIEHVGRLGGTPFAAETWDVELGPGVGIGFSELHRVRREAAEELERAILEPWSSRAPSRVGLGERSAPPRRAAARAPELVAVVADPDAAAACLGAGADRALLTVSSADPVRRLPEGVSPVLPRVAFDDETEGLLEWVGGGERVTTGNLGLLRTAARAGAVAEADWGLNAVNPWTADVLSSEGASLVWASPELSGKLLGALARSSPAPVGAVVFGRLEVMVGEHCVLRAAGACSEACATCVRRTRSWRLRDSKGYEFPVTTDTSGRSHVYNSVPLDLSRALDQVLDSGVTSLRLELGVEEVAEAIRVTAAFRRALDTVLAGGVPPREPVVEPATSGHFFRTIR